MRTIKNSGSKIRTLKIKTSKKKLFMKSSQRFETTQVKLTGLEDSSGAKFCLTLSLNRDSLLPEKDAAGRRLMKEFIEDEKDAYALRADC